MYSSVIVLKDKKPELTSRPVSSSGASNADLLRGIATNIEAIIRRNGSEKKIFAYVARHGHAEKHGTLFIRALITGVVNASISAPEFKFTENVIKDNKDVLQSYIKNNPEMELQALFAIQALMCKLRHPPGLIAAIFYTLAKGSVISNDTFKIWEKSDHPQEFEGKNICVKELTLFFMLQKETEET